MAACIAMIIIELTMAMCALDSPSLKCKEMHAYHRTLMKMAPQIATLHVHWHCIGFLSGCGVCVYVCVCAHVRVKLSV